MHFWWSWSGGWQTACQVLAEWIQFQVKKCEKPILLLLTTCLFLVTKEDQGELAVEIVLPDRMYELPKEQTEMFQEAVAKECPLPNGAYTGYSGLNGCLLDN